jgi:HK97 family phage prohead protease
MNNKILSAALEKSADTDFDARFVMSSTSLDRDQDTIDKAALAANAGKRLIALYAHKHDQPIGFWENVRMVGEKLVGDLKIASTNLGLMLKQLLAEDVPLAASIGFVGSATFNKEGGLHYKSIDIMECSLVAVPANPDAQRIAKSFGVDLKSFEEQPCSPASGLSSAAIAAISKARRAQATANLTVRKRK